MPAHNDFTSPPQVFMPADCAIPLVAERSVATLTAKKVFSISRSRSNDGMILLHVDGRSARSRPRHGCRRIEEN
jgi:hypothetical protein